MKILDVGRSNEDSCCWMKIEVQILNIYSKLMKIFDDKKKALVKILDVGRSYSEDSSCGEKL